MKRPLLLGSALVLIAGSALAAPGHLEGYVPAAAHAPGYYGSSWTTDLWIYQQGATLIHLWFNPQGEDGTATDSVVVPLSAPVTRLEDVVRAVFGRSEGVGSIHYLADGPVEIQSRTWTTGATGGSFGQTIPGIPVAAASFADSGQAGALRMVADQSPDLRSNLGLVNVTPESVTATVEIFTADGQPAPGGSTFSVELAPFAMKQVNDVLSRLEAGTRPGLIVRVSVGSGAGALLAYLSTVDNTTNDPSYQEAFRFGF